ncbi:MAG: ribosome maturation factor RimP [Actinomycetota bacterium]
MVRRHDADAVTVRAIVEAVIGEGLIVEDVVVTPAGSRRIVRVLIDNDDQGVSGISLDEIAQASRIISEALDNQSFGGATPYVLEVTSPGVDRALTATRHLRRATGRLVTFELADGQVVTGRVSEVFPDADEPALPNAVMIQKVIDAPQRGRRSAHASGHSLPSQQIVWADVHQARIQVEFGSLDGHQTQEDEN